MLSLKRIKQFKPLIFIFLLFPSFFWFYQFIFGMMGVNPIEKLMDSFGEMALRLIVLTLLISTISELKFARSIVNIRRMVGLFAFYYVLLHFSTYVVLDHFFDIQFIIKDILKRPFITFGFLSFILLIPLAFTSTNKILKKIGFKIWKRIHYMIYPAAILSSLHFYMLVRANKTEPLIYIVIIILLLLYRLIKRFIFPLMVRLLD